jgi:hypothetical protein
MTECKHNWVPTTFGIKYHYQCARCGGTIFATLKENQ